MSLSGVLDLLGVDSKINKLLIHTTNENALNFKSQTIRQDVKNLLAEVNEDSDFDGIRFKNNKLYTQPNYRQHYAFKKNNGLLKIYQYTPNLQFKLMSFHKGNGPKLYKIYQKIFVYGLFFVLVSGLWLGLTSKALKSKTIIVFIIGCLFYILLISF